MTKNAPPPSITREEAAQLAVKAAEADTINTYTQARPFVPHEWVVRAVMAGAKLGLQRALESESDPLRMLTRQPGPNSIQQNHAPDPKHVGWASEAIMRGAEQVFAPAVKALRAMRACIVYARDRRGGMFDFDTWIHMVDHALRL